MDPPELRLMVPFKIHIMEMEKVSEDQGQRLNHRTTREQFILLFCQLSYLFYQEY